MYSSNPLGRSSQMHGHGMSSSPHMMMQGMGAGGQMTGMSSMTGMTGTAQYPGMQMMHGHNQPLPPMGTMQGSEHWSGGSDSYDYRRGDMYSGNQGMQPMPSLETRDQLSTQPMDLDSGSDPDMYETSVYIGINDMPDDFDVRTRILGEKGENLQYIRRTTGAKVLMKGRGSGVQTSKPLHIFISHSTLKGMEDAEKLAQNLARVVQEDLDEYFQRRKTMDMGSMDRGHSPPHKSRRINDDYGFGDARETSGWDHSSSNLDSRDRRQGSDRGDMGHHYNASGFSDAYAPPDRDNRLRGDDVRYEGGPGGPSLGDRRDDYGSSRDRYVPRPEPPRPRPVDETKYCDLCNIHCPNQEMYYTHCKGLMHSQNLQLKKAKSAPQRRPAPPPPDRGFNSLEGTHWEGPPSPKVARRQSAQESAMTVEEWVFTCCERILEMQINSTSLRNLRRSVEKIGLRNINSALPTKPQSRSYCKLCKLETENMQSHLTSNTHGVLYLLRQIQLGDAFIEYYSDVPIPGVITDGGRVLAMDALTFGPCIPETNRERFKELLVYSGAFLSYNCKVCDTKINALNQWIQHTTSKKHGKQIVTVMIKIGFEAYVDKYKNIPVPPPKNARSLAADLVINEVHHTVPARKASLGQTVSSQVNQSVSMPQAGSSFYQKLTTLSQQDRQLVLQVQVLTGISDINVILAALNALSNMDPGMLETLCNMDSLAVEHAMAGNKALQDMDVHIVQQVIQFYTKYKFGGKIDLSKLASGKPGMRGAMSAGGSMQGRNRQSEQDRGRNRKGKSSQDDRRGASDRGSSDRGRPSRWETRSEERGGRDRRKGDQRGSEARKGKDGQRQDGPRGKDGAKKPQEKKEAGNGKQKGKGDGKVPSSKGQGDKKNAISKDRKSDKEGTPKAGDKAIEVNGKTEPKKKDASKASPDKSGNDKKKAGAKEAGEKDVIVIVSDTEENGDVYIVKSEVSGDSEEVEGLGAETKAQEKMDTSEEVSSSVKEDKETAGTSKTEGSGKAAEPSEKEAEVPLKEGESAVVEADSAVKEGETEMKEGETEMKGESAVKESESIEREEPAKEAESTKKVASSTEKKDEQECISPEVESAKSEVVKEKTGADESLEEKEVPDKDSEFVLEEAESPVLSLKEEERLLGEGDEENMEEAEMKEESELKGDLDVKDVINQTKTEPVVEIEKLAVEEVKPEEAKPEEVKPEEAKPEEAKPEEAEPADKESESTAEEKPKIPRGKAIRGGRGARGLKRGGPSRGRRGRGSPVSKGDSV